MKKLILMTALVAMLGVTMAGTATARNGNAPGQDNPNAAVRYDDYDSRLGTLDFLGNNSGFHLWFTINASSDPLADNPNYDVGSSYHNVYKWADQIDDVDPAEWCNGGGAISIPDRDPYNLGGGIPDDGSRDAYYKIWNVTTETWVCGSTSA